MTDYTRAIPMFVDESRTFINQNKPLWVVLHKTASGNSAQDIAHFFANDPNKASVHYVIGQDGTVVQCVAEKDGAGGNCCLETGHASYLPMGVNLNLRTISIEHVDPKSDNSTPCTDAQKQASFALVADICHRHSIPMHPGNAEGGIIGHCDIAPLSRARCPGNYPWDELWQHLGGGQTSMVPIGWQDDGTTLTAPNGHKVVKGFRDYVLSHNWNPSNYPMEEEHGMARLEDGNPGLGSGTQQAFRSTVLEWNSDRGVFEMWTGQELMASRGLTVKYYTLAQSLKDQLTQLQAQPIVQPAQPDPRIAQYEQRLAQIDQLAQQITQLAKV